MSNKTISTDSSGERKIFCLSMQRSGTSSVCDFLKQSGYKRVGSPFEPIQKLDPKLVELQL